MDCGFTEEEKKKEMEESLDRSIDRTSAMAMESGSMNHYLLSPPPAEAAAAVSSSSSSSPDMPHRYAAAFSRSSSSSLFVDNPFLQPFFNNAAAAAALDYSMSALDGGSPLLSARSDDVDLLLLPPPPPPSQMMDHSGIVPYTCPHPSFQPPPSYPLHASQQELYLLQYGLCGDPAASQQLGGVVHRSSSWHNLIGLIVDPADSSRHCLPRMELAFPGCFHADDEQPLMNNVGVLDTVLLQTPPAYVDGADLIGSSSGSSSSFVAAVAAGNGFEFDGGADVHAESFVNSTSGKPPKPTYTSRTTRNAAQLPRPCNNINVATSTTEDVSTSGSTCWRRPTDSGRGRCRSLPEEENINIVAETALMQRAAASAAMLRSQQPKLPCRDRRCLRNPPPRKKAKKSMRGRASEKERRQIFNDKLYFLRSLVPNISKMDKASIIGDATEYVRRLQEEVEDTEMDVATLTAALKEAMKRGLLSTEDAEEVRRVVLEPPPSTGGGGGGSFSDKEAMFQINSIVELNVTQMDKQTYSLSIRCKKSDTVLLQLCHALDTLEIEILTMNITSHTKYVIQTMVVQVQNEVANTEDVRKMIVNGASKFGIYMDN